MKRTGIALFVLILAILPLAADPVIGLDGSNQNQSTAGFEFNEYDALVNPLQFEKIGGNRLFVALDVLTSLLGEEYDATSSTKGLCAGLILGAPLAPRFMIDYADNSSAETQAAADNIVIDRAGFNVATGRFATITETVDALRTSSLRNGRDLTFHAGMVIAPGIDLALQALWRQRDYDISYLDYSNTYTDTADIAPAALTAMGNRTETTIVLPGYSNALSFQVQAGLGFGSFSTLASLGARIHGLSAPNASWEIVDTVYNAGLDPLLRDSETLTERSGAVLWDGSAVDTLITMTGYNAADLPRTELVLDTQNKLAMANGVELSFPVMARVNLFAANLASVYTIQPTYYDDALAAGASFNSRTTTTTTTNLDPDYSLGFGLGAGIKKTFDVASDAFFHASAELGMNSSFERGTISQTESVRTIVDVNSDGTLAAGTDTDTTTTRDGLESMMSENDYYISLSIPVGVTYAPFPKLSFHAGCVSYMQVSIEATASRYNDAGDYTYFTFTDALTPANSQVRLQIDGTDENAINANGLNMYFTVEASSRFGFTLKISDKFSVDALAQANNVSFSSFSLIGSIAF